MFSFLKKVVLTALTEETPVAAPGPLQTDFVDVKRLYTAITVELNEHLRALRARVDAQRVLAARAEQVFSWVARLDDDLKKTLRPDAKEVRELRELRRTQMRVPDYEHKVLPMKEDAI